MSKDITAKLKEVRTELGKLGVVSGSNKITYIFLKPEIATRLNEEFKLQYTPKGGYFVDVRLKETEEKMGPLSKYQLEFIIKEGHVVISPETEIERALDHLPHVLRNFKMKHH